MSVGPELGVASVLIVPDLRGFEAQLVAQVSAAARAAGAAAGGAGAAGGAAAGAQTAAITKQTAALEARGAVLLGVTDAELALSAAIGVEAKATAESAAVDLEAAAALKTKEAAEKLAAKAALEHAAAMETAARGAAAEGLTLFGLRGATLAASGAFLAGTASVVLLSRAVKEASDESEALFRVQRVLGRELGDGSKEWARSLADSFHLSATTALTFEGSIAETLHNVHFTTAAIAPLSQHLVELAADMAAFAHVSPEVTLRGLQLAISGNLRGLRQFGVNITAADVNMRALLNTGKATVASLTNHEKAVARLDLIYDKTKNQLGAAAARSHDLAGESAALSANLSNLGATIGGVVTPALTEIASDLNEVVRVARKLEGLSGHIPFFDRVDSFASKHRGAITLGILFPPLAPGIALAEGIRAIDNAITGTNKDAASANSTLEQTNAVLNSMNATTAGAVGGFNAMGQSINLVTGQLQTATNAAAAFIAELAAISAAQSVITNASNKILALQIQGASSAAKIAAIQEKIAGERSILKTLGGPRGARGRSALQGIASDTAQIAAIQAADAAAAKRGASAAAAAGKSAQQILDEEDQNLLTQQQIAVVTNDIAKAKAGLTKSLVDDLAADEARLKIYQQQVKDAQKIHDAVLRKQTIQQLTLDIISTRGDIKTNQAQQAQNRRDRIVNAADAKVQSAQLDADLAETLGHKKDQISALQRENRALDAEREHWKGNTLKLKEIRNQIATNNAKIKEIKGLTDDRNRLSNELAFSFLQAQQGFAATVMSNLLSAGAVAGAVGGATNAAISTRTPLGDSGILQRKGAGDFPGGPDAAVTTAAVTGAVRGATAGQMNRQISLTVEIRDLLKRLNGRATHPEANYQRAAQTTDMAHNV